MIDEASANYPKLRGRIVLAIVFLAACFFVGVTFSPQRSGFADSADRGPGDVQLYRAEVDRVRAGEPYYEAISTELRLRGYPTRSVFNWRTPLPVWLIGQLPDMAAAQTILALLGLALICLAFKLLADEGTLGQGALGVFFLGGALLPCVLGDLAVMPELWSGVLMAISAVCLGVGRRRVGIVAGIVALFFRELAAPYCLLCLVLAAWERRPRELVAWSMGLMAYAAFYALHLWEVLPRISVTDVAHADGWLCFGAAGFLISTVQMNGFLLLLPQWVSAIYLALALVGCASWNSRAGMLVALTTAGYSVAFAIAGHDFNQYWGSLTAPLLCLGACRAPWTIAGLAAAAGWSWRTPIEPATSVAG